MRGPYSSSSYDKNKRVCPGIKYDESGFKQFRRKNKKLPNPDPKNFVIEQHYECGNYVVLLVKYPDCTNYEGKKILLYQDVDLKNLKKQKSLDPHFSENKKFHSPIARFQPTEEGWNLACGVAFWLSHEG